MPAPFMLLLVIFLVRLYNMIGLGVVYNSMCSWKKFMNNFGEKKSTMILTTVFTIIFFYKKITTMIVRDSGG